MHYGHFGRCTTPAVALPPAASFPVVPQMRVQPTFYHHNVVGPGLPAAHLPPYPHAVQRPHVSSSSLEATGAMLEVVTPVHVATFRNAVSALFMQRGTEVLPLPQIRKHVLSTTMLTESQIMSCIRIMTSENQMLQSADFLCLV